MSAEKGRIPAPAALSAQELLYRLFDNLRLRDTLGGTLRFERLRHFFRDIRRNRPVRFLIISPLYLRGCLLYTSRCV